MLDRTALGNTERMRREAEGSYQPSINPDYFDADDLDWIDSIRMDYTRDSQDVLFGEDSYND